MKEKQKCCFSKRKLKREQWTFYVRRKREVFWAAAHEGKDWIF